MQPSDVDHRGEAAAGDELPRGHDGTDEPVEPVEPARRPVDWKLAFASLPIAVGIFLIGWALVQSVTGDEVTNLPEAIEEISPPPDAVQVLAQSNVVADLAEGYYGEMTIDGIEFETMQQSQYASQDVDPGTQVDIPPGVLFEAGNDTLTFTPGPAIEIDRFSEGLHTVKVTYWRVELGDATARSYTWTFNVV